MDRTNSKGEDRTNPDGEDVILRMTNDEGNAMILDIIRGEFGLDGGECGLGGQELEQVDEDEISSFLNPSGDGEEEEQVDEGQTNNNDGPSTTTGEVYILSLLWLDALIDPYIYINHSAFFF